MLIDKTNKCVILSYDEAKELFEYRIKAKELIDESKKYFEERRETFASLKVLLSETQFKFINSKKPPIPKINLDFLEKNNKNPTKR